MRAHGTRVSEFPPDAPSRTWTFARRDAAIAALGEMTVVVEAPVVSGALITAANARRLRRAVYAVPGPLGASASVGTNALIATGAARAFTGAPMLVEAVGLRAPGVAREGDDLAARVLDALAASPADPDALARRLGTSAPALAAAVARLVVCGQIAAAVGGRLARR